MNLTKVFRLFRKDTPMSRHIPITHLPSPDVFETHNGTLGVSFHLKGTPYLATEPQDLNRQQEAIARVIQDLTPDFMVMETLHRRRESTALSATFTQPFCQQVHDKYHANEFKSVYVNDLYLTLLYRGNGSSTTKKNPINRLVRALSSLWDKTTKEAYDIRRTKAMLAINLKATQWVHALSAFGIRRLGERDNNDNELIAFLSLVPNAGRAFSMKSATHYPVCAKTLKDRMRATTAYPRGHLGQYLANHRLFFGDNVQFQGNSATDVRFAALLSLKTYAKKTKNSMFDATLALDCELIRTQTYVPMAQTDALKLIGMAYSKKVSAEDYAISQLNELGDLSDKVASESLSMGFHHNTVMLMSDSREALEDAIHQTTLAYSSKGLHAVRETLGCPASFFSQIPGNAHLIARTSPITSENFADFCALHNTQSGYRDNCFLGEPITIVQTLQKTPVFWNYHLKSTQDEPALGHTLMVGATGSGKTTAALFFDSQMSRFKGHRTFFLDYEQGAKIYILACGGTYVSIHPESAHLCPMNPLQLADTLENRSFCKTWFASLLLDVSEVSLGSEMEVLINGVIEYGFDHLAPNDRTLSALAMMLPIDFPRTAQLSRWLRATNRRKAGEFAWVFDNDTDALSMDADKFGIDLTYATDKLAGHIARPIYLYVLHRINLSLTGRITSIIFDEMWKALKLPFWADALNTYLLTVRKKFAHVIGLTQSIESLKESPVHKVFMDNKATLVVFTNPDMDSSDCQNVLSLTPAETRLVQSQPKNSRMLLYKQASDAILCRLDLSPLREQLRVIAGNKRQVPLMDALRLELGSAPEKWLPAFIERSGADV